ncbi:MAG: bifunctional transaldolase/phosoglucose isomerase [Candidatus Promineofilum sp.]|nr:bifunctional transaldolase/phosoglucose isomerase [Promineifilum sp.]
MPSLTDLHQLGQSTWLNYLRNSFIRSGELAEEVRDGLQGVTANALVYERAIAGSSDYDAGIRQAMAEGKPARQVYHLLMADDIQRAADVLHPVFEKSDHNDGFVSYEVDPAIFSDVTTAVADILHVSHLIDRNNVMVEIPATDVGIEVIRALIADGISINATHLFSPDGFERVARAYAEGLAEYIRRHSAWRTTPTAVASFSLSPIDAAVDPLLKASGRPDLTGRTAVAQAKMLYARYRDMLKGSDWLELADKGVRPLRPKWTRVTPLDFLYLPNHYVSQLIGPDTVLTFSRLTLNTFRQQGQATESLTNELDAARAHVGELAALGIDLDAIAAELLQDHLTASTQRFQALIDAVINKRTEMDKEWRSCSMKLGTDEEEVERGLQTMCRQQIVCRIWAYDHTVWKPKPTEITNRLGWLHVMDAMAGQVERLSNFTRQVVNEGYTHAMLLGMGGSSLGPELFQKTFGRPARPANDSVPSLELLVVDTTDADGIRAAEAAVDLTKTLFIVSTKSGGTVETLSAFKYFYNRLLAQVGASRVGQHFIGITDPGSKIVAMAERYQFRDVFLNDPNIGGRYSALSYFGLVPAALVGTDVAELLERASIAAANVSVCHCEAIGDNLAARIGTAMGILAGSGRDKITFITSSPLDSFGDWVEQLIAESLGKEGKGILPIVGEPIAPVDTYQPDRLFVHLRLEGDVQHDDFINRLAEAGHPTITLRLKDIYDIGGQFFLWEMATAIAGHFMGINPFDQPNVEEAKIKARDIVAAYSDEGALPAGEFAELSPQSLSDFLAQARPGDYLSLQAYVQSTPDVDAALQALRQSIHLKTGLATTAGIGPRFLHSTGQLHKGDRGNGLFIQFVSDAVEDVAIPDEAGADASSMSFNVLKKAQALGDAQALRDNHRRVISFEVSTSAAQAIGELAAHV